jgi:divalent metal cation (Fe/Co/Zn/Cd) transporter
LIGLIATAILQVVIVYYSGSVALRHHPQRRRRLDGCSALARLSQSTSKPTQHFTHGCGRVEDLAAIATVLTILFSAVRAGRESINRSSPAGRAVSVGGGGSVADQVFGQRDRCGLSHLVGKEIGSAALIADGHHARIDGLTSLAVFFGAVGLYLGLPLADPLVGLAITLSILRVVWGSGKEVFTNPEANSSTQTATESRGKGASR